MIKTFKNFESILTLNFGNVLFPVCLRQNKMTRWIIKEFLRHVLIPKRHTKRQISLRERLVLIYSIGS